MGIKVFRIVLDGVVHEVEVEEIHRESRGGGQTAQGKTVGAEDGETRNMRPPVTAEAVSQNRPAEELGRLRYRRGLLQAPKGSLLLFRGQSCRFL